MLYEQAGHRCTICKAPYCDIHHIDHFANDGTTQYENLIVLCPNCHRRVHKEQIPTSQQLRHYKLKLEITDTLPVIAQLTPAEKTFLRERISVEEINELLLFSDRHYEEVLSTDYEEAKKILRRKVGLLGLEVNGIVKSDYSSTVKRADNQHVSVVIHIRLTPKGIKWIDYIKKTNQLEFLE